MIGQIIKKKECSKGSQDGIEPVATAVCLHGPLDVYTNIIEENDIKSNTLTSAHNLYL